MAEHTYSLKEVLAGGFEARCVGLEGVRYLWCQGTGLRVDPRTHATTLVCDPSALPEAGWFATRFGLRHLAEGAGDETTADSQDGMSGE
jgi:hypothetical protein